MLMGHSIGDYKIEKYIERIIEENHVKQISVPRPRQSNTFGSQKNHSEIH